MNTKLRPSFIPEHEPDTHEFEHVGFKCYLRRNDFYAWCGYVILPENHPYVGMGIFIGFYLGMLPATDGWSDYIYPAIACVLAGLGKEIYDLISDKGTCEGIDVLFTCIGGCIGATIVAVLSSFLPS